MTTSFENVSAAHSVDAILIELGSEEQLFAAPAPAELIRGAGRLRSGMVLSSSLPHAIRTLFGDGLFVVLAWVGAWYPLDVFIHQTRPQRQTIQLLEAAAQLEVVVRSCDPSRRV